ncbi:MAG: MFS transporter [Egibacteraceae bacterium]
MRLHSWRHRSVLSAAVLAVASGFAQFGVTAALPDVARAFRATAQGSSLAEQVGLSLTTIGIGLAVIRFAALASMPLAALADRVGRRRVVLSCCLTGLALTVMASGSPTFWWFVVVVALGRPLLSATNALAAVIAAEETRVADRAKAIALIAAAYGFGGGLFAFVRGVSELGFRPLFALAVVPLVTVTLIGRRLEEPERYIRLRSAESAALVVQAESSVDCEGVRNPRGDPGNAPDDTEGPGGVLPASQGEALRAGRGEARMLGARMPRVFPRGPLAQAGRPRAYACWALAPELRGRLALLAGLGFFAVAFVTGPVTTLVVLYGERVLGLTRGVIAFIVLAAGPVGFGGLAVGRWAADRLGRIPTAVVAHAGIAIAGAIAYTAGPAGAIGGYLACLFAQSVAGPAIGTLATELFPTSSRATAAGWLNAAGVLGAVGGLVTFGLLADAFGSFGPAALAVTIPMGLASAGYLLLPETRGLELEESAPEP